MLSWAKDWPQRNVLETGFVHVSASLLLAAFQNSACHKRRITHNFCQLEPEKLFSFFPSLALFFASWGCVDAFRLRCHVANCATDSKSCDPMSEILSRGYLCSRHFLCLSRVCHLVQPGSESGKHALSSAGLWKMSDPEAAWRPRRVLKSGEEDEQQQAPNSKQHPLVPCLLFKVSSNLKCGLDNWNLQLPQH